MDSPLSVHLQVVSPFLPPATVVISSPTESASSDHDPMMHIATATTSDHDHITSSDPMKENTVGTSGGPDHIATGGVVDPNEIHIATGVSFDQNHIATGGSFEHHRDEIPQVEFTTRIVLLHTSRKL